MSRRTYTREQARELIEAFDVPMALSQGERIIAVNAAYAAALGLPREQFEGRQWIDILAPEERIRLAARQKLPEAERVRTSSSFPVLVVGAEGRRVHWLARITLLPAAEGGLYRLCTCLELHDSERRQAMADLLTAVSAAMISGRSEAEVRARAIEQFRAAGTTARFISGAELASAAEGEEAEAVREVLGSGRAVFGGVLSSTATRVYIPVDGPQGREVLALSGPEFSSLDAPTLGLFARVVSSALASGRMISNLEQFGRESMRQLADTQLLLDLARTTAGSLELRAILDAASDFLVRLLDVSNCFILLYEPKARTLKGAAASSAHREFFRRVELPLDGPGIATTAAREGRPVAVEDTSRVDPQFLSPLVDHFGEKAVLALPLIARGELLGVVVVDDVRQPRPFAPEMVELAQASIGQLALSVANARLFESLRESYSELAQTRAEMVKRERLAALGELAAVVAHEVRNPLGVIFNAVSSLRRLTSAAGDAEMLLGIIAEESDRLNRIVGDLLDFARPRVLSLQLEDVGQLIRESVDAARADHSLSAKVRLDIELPGDLPQLPMDRHLLRQALVNVLMNAMQAMPQGGKVTVRARLEPGEEHRYVRIEVQDEGPGIPAELIQRVFEPFFTTKARGTGLGLAVVRRIVEDHRGEVQVHSEPGRGTTFAFRLPLRTEGAKVEGA